jgi:hypothetical protein
VDIAPLSGEALVMITLKVKCLYCDAENDPVATSGYCDSCGKKLPPASAFRHGPHSYGTTDTEPEYAPSPARRTSEALLTIAVLHLIAGGLLLVLGPVFLAGVKDYLPSLILMALPSGVALLGLAWVARRAPRAAALAALAVYLVWSGCGFLVNVPLAARWMFINLIVLALLLWPVRIAWVGREARRAS